MSGWIGRLARTWTWFWSPEDLASPAPDDPSAALSPDPRPLTLRSVFFSADDLPAAPPARPGARSFIGWVCAPDKLGDADSSPPPATDPLED